MQKRGGDLCKDSENVGESPVADPDLAAVEDIMASVCAFLRPSSNRLQIKILNSRAKFLTFFVSTQPPPPPKKKDLCNNL